MNDTTPLRVTITDRPDLVPPGSTSVPLLDWIVFAPTTGAAAVGLVPILTLEAADQLHDRHEERSAVNTTWKQLRSRIGDDTMTTDEADKELELAVGELEQIGFLTRNGASWAIQLDPPEDDSGPRSAEAYYAQEDN